MTARGSESPTLNYESREKRWQFKMSRRQVLVLVGIFTLQLAYSAYQSVRGWWLRRAERAYNTRVVPLVKSDPRFDWVYVGGEASYIRGYISPSGVVQSQNDLAALRTILQGAQPPMPLDLKFIMVSPSTPLPRATSGPSTMNSGSGGAAGG